MVDEINNLAILFSVLISVLTVCIISGFIGYKMGRSKNKAKK